MMLERLSRALLTVGLSTAAIGLLYGMWSVGPSNVDCGSAFVPHAEDNTSCALALAGRTNTAWLLVGLGGPLAAGAVVLARQDGPAAVGPKAEETA
jgi:hypothetical protein